MGWAVKAAVMAGLACLASEIPDLLGDGVIPSGAFGIMSNLVTLYLPGSHTAHQASCNALGRRIFGVPEHVRGTAQKFAARLGGFSIASKAMRTHMEHPEMLRDCAFFFCAMANFNRATSLIAGESGAVETLIEAAKRHPWNAALQAQAAASLGCWCDWTPETETKVAAGGGPDIILEALRRFPGDANMQYLGWAGLSSVSNQLPSKKIIIEAGAIDFGIGVMRDPVLNKGHRVRQEVLMAFTNLAANCNDCANDIMATGDIIEQTKQAMDEEEPSAMRGTKTDGIQLMMELARHNETSRAAILKADFINYTLTAMTEFPSRHPQDAWPLCEFALELLRFLAESSKEAKEQMLALGGVDIVKMVMAKEPSMNWRQQNGNKLLTLLR